MNSPTRNGVRDILYSKIQLVFLLILCNSCNSFENNNLLSTWLFSYLLMNKGLDNSKGHFSHNFFKSLKFIRFLQFQVVSQFDIVQNKVWVLSPFCRLFYNIICKHSGKVLNSYLVQVKNDRLLPSVSRKITKKSTIAESKLGYQVLSDCYRVSLNGISECIYTQKLHWV